MYNNDNAKSKVFSMPKVMGVNKKTRKVKCLANISKADKEGIIRLYEALVPRKELKKMRLDIIKETFPEFENIDIDKIIEKAFPAFERTIGKENFAKVKKYFGIGCKQNKKEAREVENLLSKLRTIENAQYYIGSYKELIEKTANLLEGAEEYTVLEKAKIVRMFSELFLCYFYFIEDMIKVGDELKVNYEKSYNNNKFGLYPEELFVLFVSRFKETPEKSIFFDCICFEFNKIKDKKLFKEVLEFSELEYKDEKFISINVANPYQNFRKVRGIKQRIHEEPAVTPIEYFSMSIMANQLDFGDLYNMYKLLKIHELEEFDTAENNFEKFEGSRIYNVPYKCYEIRAGQHIAGEQEKDRIINLLEIYAHKNLTMSLKFKLDTEEKLKKPKDYNVKQFFGVLKFVNDANLAMISETTLARDFEIADKLIKKDKKGIFIKYFSGNLSIEEVKAKLKIDEAFEFEFFGIKPKIEPKEIIFRFAIQKGYIESKEEIDDGLLEKVIIPGNEEIIETYATGDLDNDEFERKLGIDSEFAAMLFNLSKVDISMIEEKLLQVKRSTVGKNKFNNDLKMLVLLYCYIVEGQIACGPKKRIPKRNKALKPSILKTLV